MVVSHLHQIYISLTVIISAVTVLKNLKRNLCSLKQKKSKHSKNTPDPPHHPAPDFLICMVFWIKDVEDCLLSTKPLKLSAFCRLTAPKTARSLSNLRSLHHLLTTGQARGSTKHVRWRDWSVSNLRLDIRSSRNICPLVTLNDLKHRFNIDVTNLWFVKPFLSAHWYSNPPTGMEMDLRVWSHFLWR